MSNYIYTNDGLVNADELMHYGVPGMRWGHRKAGFVSTTKYRIPGPNSGGIDNPRRKLPGPNSGGIDNPRRKPSKYAKYAGVSTDGSKRRAAEKARQDLITSRRNKKSAKDAAFTRYEKSIRDIEKGYKRGQLLSKKDVARKWKVEKQYEKDVSNINASHKAAKKAYKVAKKMANIEAKAVKQKYKDEYMKGASIAGKIYAKLTDSHKQYADMMYEINNGSYKSSNKR